MKRFFALLLVITIFVPFSAYSESIDFSDLSSLSDEDLLKYDNMIETEKINRGFVTPILEGEYVVGRDIPAGNYIIRIVDLTQQISFHLRVYDKEKKKLYDKGEIPWRESCVFETTQIHGTDIQFHLDESNILYLSYDTEECAVFIEKAPALFMD